MSILSRLSWFSIWSLRCLAAESSLEPPQPILAWLQTEDVQGERVVCSVGGKVRRLPLCEPEADGDRQAFGQGAAREIAHGRGQKRGRGEAGGRMSVTLWVWME